MEKELENIKIKLEEAMAEYAKEDICLAFSGGVDSSLLLKVAADAVKKTGKKVYAVTFDSRLHPSCDLEIAAGVAKELGGIHKVVTVDELEQEEIRFNPVNRCYLCKNKLFKTLKEFAKGVGISSVMDGTNEDDMHVYRPGIKALRELGIVSLLAQLHITKAQVKKLAAEYGISVASRPSAPCMATRLPYNTEINYDILERIGQGEEFLRTMINGNVRLRLHNDIARIEVDSEAMEGLINNRERIVSDLKEMGFSYITVDLEGFRSGSMDIGIDPVL
ncbi:ATP-dependent sacrificial sulfur transferase LarE [Sedimentibacter hydroxybenzoicus DSM 7310]|uniref:ATP-dependent sacrificial sulfur transferase LarE n=1 Tax=Sedimentibacter hydroxybenzoicus DSM 7310 TaxID=1123245 RepID=A0A974GW74_SEDHY|nr:ATP-dependent sacrificial sulfur transferase LarE [Sedimentibacter hydroxybenzoicus]NYB73765.1 ATP-dependent sacrificial sulfur transferase LarE [Sedimentibacter hydroxybenzoicus DSM 7310]